MKIFSYQIVFFFFFINNIVRLLHCHCQALPTYKFVVKEAPYRRLCSTKNILTVNGQFPGPTLHVHRGETIIVDVYNRGRYNITLHWHGVKQPRNPWADGPEYITQCPITPGGKFRQRIIFSTEEGTLWWHAHNEWTRATVHGAVIVYPKRGTAYPFPKPYAEVPIILGEWWKQDIVELYNGFLKSGGDPNVSNAYLINGQPGDLYPCSQLETFKLVVDYGKTYLLRMINAAMQDILFFAIANHNLTTVGSDGSYTKPFTTDYIAISPGQTIDVLLHTSHRSNNHFYIAAKAYSSAFGIPFDNTTTTAILQYIRNGNGNDSGSSLSLQLPYLPNPNDTIASVSYTGRLRSLASKDHPIDVPMRTNTNMFVVVSMNSFLCPNNSCAGPNGTRLSASLNNISFVNPKIDILESYYHRKKRVYGKFPDFPQNLFNFTADFMPLELQVTRFGTKVKVLEYNETVEIVFQVTNLVAGTDHPMHLHGYSFYVVGWGLGNFDQHKDPLGYNLVDPPLQNTIAVPKNGWTTIRFKADNPGVWFMHCHLDRHMIWGMSTVLIVRDGKTSESQMLPPPPDMPHC